MGIGFTGGCDKGDAGAGTSTAGPNASGPTAQETQVEAGVTLLQATITKLGAVKDPADAKAVVERMKAEIPQIQTKTADLKKLGPVPAGRKPKKFAGTLVAAGMDLVTAGNAAMKNLERGSDDWRAVNDTTSAYHKAMIAFFDAVNAAGAGN